MSLWLVLIGMIAHGRGNVKVAQYAFDLYSTDSNHIIGTFAQILLI